MRIMDTLKPLIWNTMRLINRNLNDIGRRFTLRVSFFADCQQMQISVPDPSYLFNVKRLFNCITVCNRLHYRFVPQIPDAAIEISRVAN